MKIEDLVKAAKETGSYFLTLTTRDKNAEENNLRHYVIQEDFPRDDIVPSVDNAIRSMGVKPEKLVDIIKPEPIVGETKPLKIAVITHFNRCPDSYSPCKAVKNQIKLLQRYGHTVVFFTAEGSQLDIGCEMRPVVPRFKREKNIVNEEIKLKFIDILRRELTNDFDLAITHDLYIDDCITYREAVRECGVPIKWLHWARSGVGHSINFSMNGARYVYMNKADVGQFARNIGVDSSLVRVVYNEKDPSLLFGWDPITVMINEKMRLWEKDVIQAYPICTTRMDAKGINSVIRTFAALKKLGNKVALIICNSNGRRRLEEIKSKQAFARECGLDENDFVFTSTLSTDEYPIHSEVPHKVVVQLLNISNLFVFPTIAEVCSNVLLEASMNKNLMVLNSDLPSLFDFADSKNVLSYPFTSLRSLHYSGREDKDLDELAKNINGQLKANKPDQQFRHVWRTHSMYSIYKNQLRDIIYE